MTLGLVIDLDPYLQNWFIVAIELGRRHLMSHNNAKQFLGHQSIRDVD
jgi:hypothetical protein